MLDYDVPLHLLHLEADIRRLDQSQPADKCRLLLTCSPPMHCHRCKNLCLWVHAFALLSICCQFLGMFADA